MVVLFSLFRGDFSAKSSTALAVHAQRKGSPVTARDGFPHFHSDGYYYYLYTSIKTGYSSCSQTQSSHSLPAEEILQWNSV
jgi:hypothetical protein